MTSLDQIAGKTTQEDTGTSNAQFINHWNQKHTDNPATIDFSGEDIGKRILDLANGEFDFLVFDKVSVQKIIKDRGLDLSVVDLPSADSPSNYIIFLKRPKEFKENLIKRSKNSIKTEPSKKTQQYLSRWFLPPRSISVTIILFENLQTTSALSATSKLCFEQPTASFLVCSLIFIEYKIY